MSAGILSRPRCRKARSRFDGFVREAKDLKAHSVQFMREAKDLKLPWSRGSQEVGEDVQHPSCIFPGTIV